MTDIVSDKRLRSIARSCPEFENKLSGLGALSASTAGETTSARRCDVCMHFHHGSCHIYTRKRDNDEGYVGDVRSE